MDENGIIMIGKNEIHIQALWFEIFRSGMRAHESWKGKADHELQVLFDYWLKEKLGQP